MFCPVLELAKILIRKCSLSPNDAGCQEIIISRLKALKFNIELMNFGKTFNFWGWHGYNEGKTLVFAGHTDVAPIGNIKNWHSPPFKPVLSNGMLYGRGAADMKGSLAAMIIAVERFIKKFPNHPGKIAFIITSDEETEAKDGTKKVVEKLMARNEQLDYCLLGEPSSNFKIGDVIKNGRRGSLTANLVIKGIQGHVAYPHLIDNPIHRTVTILNELISIKWDKGNKFFPPSTMQIVNINSDINSDNTTPSECKIKFNFRFNTELTDKFIQQRVNKLIQKHNLCYDIDWYLSGQPFLTSSGKLLDVVIQVIEHYQKIKPRLETNGGTSDGRFIALMGTQIVEVGLINRTIHKIDECTSITDLRLLSYIYQRIMEKLLL